MALEGAVGVAFLETHPSHSTQHTPGKTLPVPRLLNTKNTDFFQRNCFTQISLGIIKETRSYINPALRT